MPIVENKPLDFFNFIEPENSAFNAHTVIKSCRMDDSNFKEIVEYIKETDVYKDPNSMVTVTDNTITFGYPLYAVLLMFPKLKMYWNLKPDMVIHNIFVKNCEPSKQPSASEIESFYRRFNNPSLQKSNLTRREGTETAMFELLEENNGLVIGEQHDSESGKKLLIENMERFKNEGVQAIFLEHVPKTLAPMLEKYCNAEDQMEMPAALKSFLMNYDNQYASTVRLQYGLLALVEAAKKNHIQIVPFDTQFSYDFPNINLYDDDRNQRRIRMNYQAGTAYESYKKNHPEGKCLFFVGTAHINQNGSKCVPGLAEITGNPAIAVIDEHATIDIKLIEAVKPELIIKVKKASSLLDSLISAHAKKPTFFNKTLYGFFPSNVPPIGNNQNQHFHLKIMSSQIAIISGGLFVIAGVVLATSATLGFIGVAAGLLPGIIAIVAGLLLVSCLKDGKTVTPCIIPSEARNLSNAV